MVEAANFIHLKSSLVDEDFQHKHFNGMCQQILLKAESQFSVCNKVNDFSYSWSFDL